MTLPTPLISLPPTISRGEIAATTPAIVVISFSVFGFMLPILSASFETQSAAFLKLGPKVFATVEPSLPRLPFICALSVSRESFMSFRSASVSPERMRPMSSASLPNFFSDAPPSSMIPAKLSAPLPKSSIAAWSRSVSFSILESASMLS